MIRHTTAKSLPNTDIESSTISFNDMYRKIWIFFKNKNFITFALNELCFSCVNSLYSSSEKFTTQLGIEMFSLMDDINQNSCLTFQDTQRSIDKYFCCNSCQRMAKIYCKVCWFYRKNCLYYGNNLLFITMFLLF